MALGRAFARLFKDQEVTDAARRVVVVGERWSGEPGRATGTRLGREAPVPAKPRGGELKVSGVVDVAP